MNRIGIKFGRTLSIRAAGRSAVAMIALVLAIVVLLLAEHAVKRGSPVQADSRGSAGTSLIPFNHYNALRGGAPAPMTASSGEEIAAER